MVKTTYKNYCPYLPACTKSELNAKTHCSWRRPCVLLEQRAWQKKIPLKDTKCSDLKRFKILLIFGLNLRNLGLVKPSFTFHDRGNRSEKNTAGDVLRRFGKKKNTKPILFVQS